MSDTRLPPHPGPRPTDFTFPYAAATQTAAVIETAMGAFDGLIAQHQAAAGHVRSDFEGDSRAAFDAWLADALDALRADRRRLAEQLDALQGARRDARQHQQAADGALARWEQRRRAYDTAVQQRP